jgi:hypothetical protein
MPNDATSAFESRNCVSVTGCLKIDEKAFVPGIVSMDSYGFNCRLDTLFEKPASGLRRYRGPTIDDETHLVDGSVEVLITSFHRLTTAFESNYRTCSSIAETLRHWTCHERREKGSWGSDYSRTLTVQNTDTCMNHASV